MARPKTDRKKRTLRLPRDVDAQVMVAARENGRSDNAEIVQRLKASFEGYRKL